jgi:ubiquinone/menaquinone biosynthesis C-methylase UbiE
MWRAAAFGRRVWGNASLLIGDASSLCFRSDAFDGVFMSFTLELFESAIPRVLDDVRRVLHAGGRVGVVAMADTSEEAAHFHAGIIRVADIWGLPVAIAVGTKAVGSEQEGPTR